MTQSPSTDLGNPEGWQLVPIKPDVGMIAAWYRYKNGHRFAGEEPARDTSDVGAWAAMLAAAPSPPIPLSAFGGDQQRIEELEEALKAVLAALAAATSILDRADLAGRRPSKVVGSDNIFIQMLKDYARAEIKGRVALSPSMASPKPRVGDQS